MFVAHTTQFLPQSLDLGTKGRDQKLQFVAARGVGGHGTTLSHPVQRGTGTGDELRPRSKLNDYILQWPRRDENVDIVGGLALSLGRARRVHGR